METKTKSPYKILIVDDDLRLQSLLSRYLMENGFVTTVASNAAAMYKLTLRNIYQLYILDVNLPGDNGLLICQRLRASGNKTPVLMLTARGEDGDRILGLDIGADDYLTKPFNPRELLARINSVLRRYAITYGVYTPQSVQCNFGKYILDAEQGKLLYEDNPVPLNHQEFVLLQYLVQNSGEILSRTQISERLYGSDIAPNQRGIDMMICRLRKKLQENDEYNYIHTIRGIGYVFEGRSANNKHDQ